MLIVSSNNEFRLKRFCWESVFEGCCHLLFHINFELKEHSLTDYDTGNGSSLSVVLEIDHINKHGKDSLREFRIFFSRKNLL